MLNILGWNLSLAYKGTPFLGEDSFALDWGDTSVIETIVKISNIHYNFQ